MGEIFSFFTHDMRKMFAIVYTVSYNQVLCPHSNLLMRKPETSLTIPDFTSFTHLSYE